MAERALPVYAFDRWTVRPGNGAAFVVAWTALIDWTLDIVPGLVGRQGQLLQDIARSSEGICPLAWESAAALEAWRALPTFGAYMAVLRQLSDDCQLRTLEVVHRLDEPRPGPATNVFTVDHWTLRPDRDKAFVATWTAFITWTVRDVADVAPAVQRLFRDVDASAQVFCPLA
jgi:heme-degrading monooxygenase HmoA